MGTLYALKLGRRYVINVATGKLGSLIDAQKFDSYKDARLNIDDTRGEEVVKIEIRDVGVIKKGRPAA